MCLSCAESPTRGVLPCSRSAFSAPESPRWSSVGRADAPPPRPTPACIWSSSPTRRPPRAPWRPRRLAPSPVTTASRWSRSTAPTRTASSRPAATSATTCARCASADRPRTRRSRAHPCWTRPARRGRSQARARAGWPSSSTSARSRTPGSRASARAASRSSATWPRTGSSSAVTTPRWPLWRSSATSEPFIRAVTPYTAADKRLPGLRAAGRSDVVVTTVAGEAGAAARDAVARVSARRGTDVPVGRLVQQRVNLDAAALDALADHGGVVAIQPFTAPELHDERAAQIVAGKLDASFRPELGSGYRTFLLNRGFPSNSVVTVDITDSGVDKGVHPAPAGSHPDFYRAHTATNRIRYAQESSAADADARDCFGHGTNVASIATGYNNADGRRGRGRPGLQLRRRHPSLRPARHHQALQLRGQLRPHDLAHRAAQRGLRLRRADLEQLLGHDERVLLGALRRLRAGVRRTRARRAAEGGRPPADHRGHVGRQQRARRRTRSAHRARART